jgi:hypothetical protein
MSVNYVSLAINCEAANLNEHRHPHFFLTLVASGGASPDQQADAVLSRQYLLGFTHVRRCMKNPGDCLACGRTSIPSDSRWRSPCQFRNTQVLQGRNTHTFL